MSKLSFTIVAALTAAAFAAPAAHAAVGNSMVYSFNTQSTAGATPTVSQASLLLTETASGVNFKLTPDWHVSNGDRVQQIQFAYSGDAASFSHLAGPAGSASFGMGAIDSGYNSAFKVTISWPSSGSNEFDDHDAFSSWSLNGASIDLTDFGFTAGSSSKPAPAFGAISMPGARPSNWVALGSLTDGPPVAAIPEPETYALMGMGLAAMGFVVRRRKAEQP